MATKVEQVQLYRRKADSEQGSLLLVLTVGEHTKWNTEDLEPIEYRPGVGFFVTKEDRGG